MRARFRARRRVVKISVMKPATDQTIKPRRVCEARWLGLTAYGDGLRLQEGEIDVAMKVRKHC